MLNRPIYSRQQALPRPFHPFVELGQHVRIRSRALNGVEGTLVSRDGTDSLNTTRDNNRSL